MLLRESLTDKDIPRRDKLRETIIAQFEKEFLRLKVELSVGYISSLTKLLLTLLMAGLSWPH